MFFSRAAFTVAALALASVSVEASHTITLRNNCAWGVDLLLNNWSGPAYNGPPIGNIGAYSSKSIVVDDGWDGRICDTPASSGCSNSCYGSCSMTEFNMNAYNGLNFYDVSNIQAYTVPQQISSSCGSVTCTSQDCPCDQAYRPGDTSGTCNGSGPVDQAVRACGSADFTVTYCP